MNMNEHYRSTVRLKVRWRQLSQRSGVPLAELHRASDARFLFIEHGMSSEEEAEFERLVAEEEAAQRQATQENPAKRQKKQAPDTQ